MSKDRDLFSQLAKLPSVGALSPQGAFLLEFVMENENKDLLLKSKELIASLTTALEENMKLVEKQSVAIKEMEPLVEFAHAIIQDDKHYSWQEASKLIHEKLYEGRQVTGQRGRNKLIQFLRECDIIRPRTTEPYQQYISQGLFTVKALENAHVGTLTVTRVTGKGLQWLIEKLIDWEYVDWLGVKIKEKK